jgi:hypothetical protein
MWPTLWMDREIMVETVVQTPDLRPWLAGAPRPTLTVPAQEPITAKSPREHFQPILDIASAGCRQPPFK